MALTKAQMAQRIARDVPPGTYVNLGVGIPTLVAGYISPDAEVVIHSENGILGIGGPAPAGQEDPDLVDAGKNPIVVRPGAAFFHHADSFAMLRGGRVDIAVLGAYQVSAAGDLANWKVPGGGVPNVGGAMDIVAGVKQVWVVMTHTGPDGQPKIVPECTYPLTARGVVRRIYTDLAVLEVTPAGLALIEVSPGVTVAQVVAATGTTLRVPEALRGA
jgi:3-oxoacid CoA-transferase B subunit